MAERTAPVRERETTAKPGGIGAWVPRKEDDRLLRGDGRFTDDVDLPHTLHMAVLRSPMAHARITRVDVSAALSRPGVVAAYSGADLGDKNVGALCVWPVTEDTVMPPHLALAVDKVRYVGDAVAVVIAGNRYQAADALEAIEVDYEPLPPVLDMRAATRTKSTG